MAEIETYLEDRLPTARLFITRSNGGAMAASEARCYPVQTLLSGPASGVTAACFLGQSLAGEKLLTMDMGGTSTDLSLIVDGRPTISNAAEVGDFPLMMPVTGIEAIGAGGGSVVWVDDGGMLRIGPHSSGADPGPACYGRGGERPTLTDAHVIRNTVRPEAFLGGRMEIFADRSRTALQPVAELLGMSLEDAADSAIQLANANVVRAIQLISTERGFDPRDYVLVPFGGAGPLHAASVASDLGVSEVVVPPSAGVVSAFGLIASDFTQFSSLTRRVVVDDLAPDVVRETCAAMRADALEKFKALKLRGEPVFDFVADMRFVGQAFEVPVSFDLASLETLSEADIRARFQEEHHKVFFFGGASGKPIELVSFRLGMTLPVDQVPVLSEDSSEARASRDIDLYINRGWQKGRLVGHGSLATDAAIAGPALLEDPTSTLFLPQGWQAVRDAHHNTIMTRT